MIKKNTKSMGYVIKVQNRAGGMTMYIGAVPGHDDKANVVDNLEEASKCPWPTVEEALEVVSSFPKTENLDYEVISTQKFAPSQTIRRR
jgi:hypothetical protein